MSGEALRVTTAHLRKLAAKQAQAAAEITSATEVVDDVDTSVRVSHGVIAWSTASAVEAIQHARRTAGNGIAAASNGMSENLAEAASRYDQIDGAMGRPLDQEMRPR
jgi:Excreted virulence factor EspC, type VII ESX diderm